MNNENRNTENIIKIPNISAFDKMENVENIEPPSFVLSQTISPIDVTGERVSRLIYFLTLIITDIIFTHS